MVTIIPPRPENNRFAIPESTRQNEEFENFVLSILFPSELYTLLERSDNLKLKDNTTGIEFYIQCKHRFSIISNSLTFFKQSHINSINNPQPLFLVLGLGGAPEVPGAIYLINIADCPHHHLFKRHLKNKAVDIDQPVPSTLLWKDVRPLKPKVKRRA